MPITSSPTFNGTLYTRTPFLYTFASDVSYGVNPSYQFTDSSPAILAATNDASASFSSSTGYVGTGSLGNLIVDYISSNVISTSNIASGSFSRLNDGGITSDSLGNIYLCDCNAVVKVTPSGVVSTFAGSKFVSGSADGPGATALFAEPTGLACDGNDNIYVADQQNSLIRKITSGGIVSTFAGTRGVAEYQGGPLGYNSVPFPHSVAVDSNSNVYCSGYLGGTIVKITPDGYASYAVGFGANGSSDGTGNLYETYSNVFVTGITGGAGGTSRRMAFSLDGQTWTILGQNPLTSYVRRVAKNSANVWAAVGSNTGGWNTSFASSGDGSNWSRARSGQPYFESGGYDIAFGNSEWIAVGNGTTNTMIRSPDAKAWTGIGKPAFTTAGYGIVWTGSLWVAVGEGTRTIAYSSDGTSWTGGSGTTFDTLGRSVAYASGRFVAVGGSNTPAITSTDGSNWTAITGLTDISSGRSVIFGNGTWVLLGNTDTGLGRGYYSTNGTTWTRNTSLDFTSNAFGLMQNDGTGIWVATGMNSGGTSSIRYTSTPTGTWNTNTVVQEEPYIGGATYTDTQMDSQGTVGVVPIRTVLSSGFLTLPRGITFDGSGNLYIVDQDGSKIRQYSPDANQLTTYAGVAIQGYVDGAFTSARFSNARSIAWSSADRKFYVGDTSNFKIRTLDSNTSTVSTYGIPTLSANPYAVLTFGSNQYYTTQQTLTLVVPPRTEVRPSGTRPSGYVIADTLTVPVTVSNRIDASSAAVGGVFQLYKYEPFGVNFYSVNQGASTTDTLSYVNSSAELFAFLSNVSGSQVTFASTNGPSVSYTNPLSLIIDDLSGSTVLETISNTVYMNPGRFFPPAANTAYVFYKNEPITPQTFSATISLQTPTSAPTIPAGLSFTRTASNSFQLAGTPLVQSPSSNYKVIGRGLTNPGQTVTVDINIRVAAERMLMDISGSSNVFSMQVNTPISNRVVTSRCPPYPNVGSNILYTWFPPLPAGLSFQNVSNVAVSSGYLAIDASSTLVLTGTPTEAAAQTISNGYQTTLYATRTTSPFISNAIPFTFSFGESVVFGSSNLTTLYTGASVSSSSSSNSFTAQTKFATVDSSITAIFSPDLRSDLSLNFVFAQQRAFLTGTPASAGVGTYTVTAVNGNAVSNSITASYTISNDQTFFDYTVTPAIDTCYNFVDERPISNALSGYYPYPIDFSVYTLSGCNVVFTSSGLPTGVTLSNVTTNRVRLAGIPTVPTALTTATITATANGTGATNSTTIKTAVVSDSYTFNDVSLSYIENVASTPVQISATTIGGFPIIQYSSSNLPAGLNLSAAGLLTGAIQVGVDGSFSVDATTGYTTGSKVYDYAVVPDSILLTTPQSSYVVPAGANVSIPVTGIAYSGRTVSNYQFSNLPTTYGLSIDGTSGIISGTVDPVPPTNVAFAVQGSVGSRVGTLDASWNDPIISFARTTAGGPVVTSPAVRTVVTYQYMPIEPIVCSGSGTGRVYFFVDSTQLPRGLTWNAITQTLSGSPVVTGSYPITFYARDSVATTSFTVTFEIMIPRIIRKQDGAGAYTSLVRQYAEVNAAQGGRDSRVFPSQERALGEFMAPDAPVVVTQSNCPVCKP